MAKRRKHFIEPFLNIHALKTYAEASARRHNFSVRFDDNTQVPYTTADKQMVFPSVNPNWTDDDLYHMWWYAVHEPLHWSKGPKMFDYLRTQSPDFMQSPRGYVLNVVEDCRIETAGATEFLGDAEALTMGWLSHLKKLQTPDMQKKIHDTAAQDQDELFAKSGAVWAMSSVAREDWNLGVKREFGNYLGTLPQTTQKWYNDLLRAGYLQKYKAMKSEQDAVDLSKDLCNFLQIKDPDKPNANFTNKQQQGQGQGGQGGQQGKKGGQVTVPYDVFAQSGHKAGDPGVATTYDWSNFKQGGAQAWSYNPDDVDVIHVKHHRFRDIKTGQNWGPVGAHQCPPMESSVRRLASRLRAAMQVASYTKYTGTTLKGRLLSSGSIYRAGLPDEFGDLRRRVFRNKYKRDVLNTAIVLNIDCSGSMSGSKLRLADDIARGLNTSLVRTLRMPVEVSCYTSGRGPNGASTVLGLVQKFGESVTDEDLNNRVLSFYSNFAGITPSGPALMAQLHRLQQRTEPRKILFHITDGAPNGSNGDAIQMVRDVAIAAEKAGVEMYGVGVMDNAISRTFKQYIYARSMDEFVQAVLGKLLRLLFEEV